MAAITIGSRGLLNADIILVQGVSFSCVFVHEDAEGEPIDHAGASAWCRIQGGRVDIDLTDRVSFGTDGEIVLAIPDELTATIPTGTYNWDLIVEDATGYASRIAWGNARVYDSYARD